MADGYKQDFVQINTPGLQALFKSGQEVTVTAIVGYLRNEKGDLVAAIIGDGGKVVPAASMKTFCGVRWESPASFNMSGGSIFEKVFGGKF